MGLHLASVLPKGASSASQQLQNRVGGASCEADASSSWPPAKVSRAMGACKQVTVQTQTTVRGLPSSGSQKVLCKAVAAQQNLGARGCKVWFRGAMEAVNLDLY